MINYIKYLPNVIKNIVILILHPLFKNSIKEDIIYYANRIHSSLFQPLFIDFYKFPIISPNTNIYYNNRRVFLLKEDMLQQKKIFLIKHKKKDYFKNEKRKNKKNLTIF
jgi:hypothetical protein